MNASGTDISHWNAFKPGRDFTFHKATGGLGYVDPDFAARWKLLEGSVRGAYCFLELGDGSNQADFFLSVVKPVAGDILALDYEAAGLGYAQANDWVDRVQAKAPDNKVVVYGHPADVNQIHADKWVALWGSKQPSPPWTFWQYGSIGVDADKFNGDAAALAAYAGGDMDQATFDKLHAASHNVATASLPIVGDSVALTQWVNAEPGNTTERVAIVKKLNDLGSGGVPAPFNAQITPTP